MAYCEEANMVPYFGPYIIRVPLLGGTRGGTGCMRATYEECSLDPQFHQKYTVSGRMPYGGYLVPGTCTKRYWTSLVPGNNAFTA